MLKRDRHGNRKPQIGVLKRRKECFQAFRKVVDRDGKSRDEPHAQKFFMVVAMICG
jgi:hypothetical protein